MNPLLTILTFFFISLITSCRDKTPATVTAKIEFSDQDFRNSIIELFKKERLDKDSHFFNYKETFIDDPSKIEFGEYWNENSHGFNYFIIDREQMKYEYNYMIVNSGIKIHGDIKQVGDNLRCEEPVTIRFMHINRGH